MIDCPGRKRIGQSRICGDAAISLYRIPEIGGLNIGFYQTAGYNNYAVIDKIMERI
jgi:hypothetical protein